MTLQDLDLQLARQFDVFEEIHPAELRIIGCQERGHRTGLVRRRCRHSRHTLVEQIPAEQDFLRHPRHWVDEDRPDDRARRVDRFVRWYHLGHPKTTL